MQSADMCPGCPHLVHRDIRVNDRTERVAHQRDKGEGCAMERRREAEDRFLLLL